VDPKLRDLIESGGLDWDDDRHREAYLKAWAAGVFSAHPPEVPRVAVTGGG
jgi:hypothetical protein